MDDWQPLVALLLQEVMKGEYGSVGIPREYFKAVEGLKVSVKWDDTHCFLSLDNTEAVDE